jgi:hypothetical protein
MTSMTCWTRACARLHPPCGGEVHVDEIRLRPHLHILKTDSIHFSAIFGPALKRHCGPRMVAVAVCGCLA